MDAGSLALSPNDEARSLWSSVRHAVAARPGAPSHDDLDAHAACLGQTASTLRVAVTAEVALGWSREGHLEAIQNELSRVSEGVIDLALLPVDDARTLGCDPTCSFESWIVGPANQVARERARDYALRGGGRPLVLQGPPAAGKSHLIHAMAHAFDARREARPVRLKTGEQLALDLVNAIWNTDLTGFREELRGCGAFLLDDVQALAGKDASQEELVHTLDALGEREVPVVIGSARPPAKLAGLLPALRERLERATQLLVSPPEWETRVAIVLDRVRRWGLATNPEVAAFLAGKLRANLGRLDVLLTSLVARPSCSRSLDDLDVVRHALSEAGSRSIRVSPEDVLAVVSRHFSVKLRDLRSASRSPRVTRPRQIAMYLVRRHCGHSYPEIGRRFGRHHTTALHSDRLVRRHIDQNGSLRAAVVLLEKELLRLSDDGG